jgi:nitrous oxidase accessory protein
MIRITLAISFFCLFFHVQSETIPICESCKVTTIHEGVERANSYDTLLVAKGIYVCENVEVIKPLTIIGDSAILDGRSTGYILKILSDSVHLEGLKLINSGRSYTKDWAAIYVSRSSHFSISSIEIEDPFFGILLEKSHYGVVKNSKIRGHSKREDDAGNGIHLWHCTNIEITENEIHGQRDGIYLEFVDNSTIHQNYSHNNVRYGLHFMFSNHDKYVSNTFKNNGAGVAVMFSKFILMQDNLFIENWGTASYGLLLKEIYDGEVLGNKFTENTIGIFIEGCTRMNYSLNEFERNGWAIKVSGGCYANHFMKNNFIGNSFDVSYNTKMNDNRFSQNYWSDYTGYDLDKNGIGDIPYRPVKLFSYIVNQTPEAIILLRSLFINIIDFSEKVSPIFTPDDLMDSLPSMKPF